MPFLSNARTPVLSQQLTHILLFLYICPAWDLSVEETHPGVGLAIAVRREAISVSFMTIAPKVSCALQDKHVAISDSP